MKASPSQSEMENPNASVDSTNRRLLPALTSLRGLAAIWVLSHNDLFLRTAVDQPISTRLLAKGYLAVDFFLVLSGFVLAYVYLSRSKQLGVAGYWKYLGLRLARIYPLYFALLLARGGWEFAKLMRHTGGDSSGPTPFTGAHSFEAWLSNALMIQAWGGYDYSTWISSFWSISVEWFAYLAFPFFAMFFSLGSRRPLLWSLGIQVGCFAGLAIFSSRLVFDQLEFPIQFSLLRCIPEFLIGMGLVFSFQALATQVDRYAWIGRFASAIVPLLLTAGFVGILVGIPDVCILMLFCAVLLFAPLAVGPVKWLLELRILQGLGAISYAVYLVHLPVHNLTAGKFEAWNVENVSIVYLLKLAAILAIATVLHVCLERPARAYFRKKITKR